MKIASISVYQVDLPLHEGNYKFANGKEVKVFDSTVVRIETDAGITGWGENCPLGPAYLPAYAKGTREGIRELAPHLIGEDPTLLLNINQLMDSAMKGHNYVKSAIDMACWDILGKHLNTPVCILLGGRFEEKYKLYRAISQESPEEMAAMVLKYKSEGYTKFQLKVGGDVNEDMKRIKAVREALDDSDLLMADANCGWLMHDAVRLCNNVKDMDVYVEQPCETYEENLSVRNKCSNPFIIDENITDMTVIIRLAQDKAADVINLKISKVGGLTKARQIRDLCMNLGIAMNIEDTWGGDIVTSAISHLAHSTPPKYLFASTDFNSYVTVSIAEGAPQRKDGYLQASKEPGLGVTPRMDVLGDPLYTISSQ